MNERLYEKLADLKRDCPPFMTGTVIELQFEIDKELSSLKAQLAEAKKDAGRWNFFIEVLRKDMGESIAKFLPEEPMENFTKEMIDVAIDQAMRDSHEQNEA